MRKIRDIIESPFPVPTNALWLNGANLKGFINGKWVTLGGAGEVSWNDIKDKPNIPEAYTLPTASATMLGGVKSSTTGTTSGKDYLVQVNSDGTMKVNVPWTNTTYSVVTEQANGLMSVALLQKLNGIEAQANNYILPAAGTSIGGVKKAAAVADLAGTEDASAICTKVNELLSSLRSAGVLGV